jgi:hypothetical protein
VHESVPGHFSDVPAAPTNVRFQGQSSRAAEILRRQPISDIDRVEIPQRSSALCAIPFVRKHGRYWAVRRRELITLFGVAVVTWPFAARAAAAQGKMRRTPSRQCLSRLIAIYQNSSTYLTRLQFSPATRPVLAGNSPGSNLFAAPTLAAYRVQAFNMDEKSFCASVRSFGLFGPSSDAK